jgi:hypothetical protein
MCVKLEKEAVPVDLKVVGQLYEDATLTFGQSEGTRFHVHFFFSFCLLMRIFFPFRFLAEIWLDYISWELEQKNVEKAGKLYWRAKHTIKNPTLFVLKYNEMINAKK